MCHGRHVMLSLSAVKLDCHITSFVYRNSSAEAPQKVTPRVARKLRPTALECDSASSSNQANKTIKERSPKVIDRKSPRSPACEVILIVHLVLVES